MIRNGTYTSIEGSLVELNRMRNGEFHLVIRDAKCSIPGFEKRSDSLFVRVVDAKEITNGVSVSTFAKYKGNKFFVESLSNGKLRLTTSNEALAKSLKLHMVDRGWYDTEVSLHEIEQMWEVRSKSGYGFPFPEGLKEIEEIKF